MNYDVVSNSIASAYRYYGNNDTEFYFSMKDFYTEGAKSPSVAKIMLNDYLYNKKKQVGNMLQDVSTIPVTRIPLYAYPEAAVMQKNIYGTAISSAMKCLSAQDIYRNTAHFASPHFWDNSRKDFDDEWNRLYPKTGKIRERIIDANRISMDHVTKKADWFEKINFIKSIAEYKKDYPKTFFARYWLIYNNQIEEGHVTSRVKNWFKRFSYKRLIKDGFSFKK